MQTCERFGIALGPSNLVNAPRLTVGRFLAEHRRGGQFEPVRVYAKAVPFGQLGPGLCLELIFGVGGYDALRILAGANRPQHDPSDKSGFTDTVAGRHSDLDGFLNGQLAVFESIPNFGQDVPLPFIGAVRITRKLALAPFESSKNVAKRV